MISLLDLPSEAPSDVAAGTLIDPHAHHTDQVQGAVGVPVAASVQAVAHDLAGGGFYGRDAAKAGEGGLAVQALRIVSGQDEQGGGVVRADGR